MFHAVLTLTSVLLIQLLNRSDKTAYGPRFPILSSMASILVLLPRGFANERNLGDDADVN